MGSEYYSPEDDYNIRQITAQHHPLKTFTVDTKHKPVEHHILPQHNSCLCFRSQEGRRFSKCKERMRCRPCRVRMDAPSSGQAESPFPAHGISFRCCNTGFKSGAIQLITAWYPGHGVSGSQTCIICLCIGTGGVAVSRNSRASCRKTTYGVSSQKKHTYLNI
jgi:hypothetical protein